MMTCAFQTQGRQLQRCVGRILAVKSDKVLELLFKAQGTDRAMPLKEVSYSRR